MFVVTLVKIAGAFVWTKLQICFPTQWGWFLKCFKLKSLVHMFWPKIHDLWKLRRNMVRSFLHLCSFLMVTSKRKIRSSVVNIPQWLSNLQLWNSCCNNKQLNESSKKKSVGRRKVRVRFVATCRRWNSHYSPKGSPSPEPLTTSSPHPYDSIVDPWLLTLTSLRTPTFVTWSNTSWVLHANVRVEIVGVLLVWKVFLLEI